MGAFGDDKLKFWVFDFFCEKEGCFISGNMFVAEAEDFLHYERILK